MKRLIWNYIYGNLGSSEEVIHDIGQMLKDPKNLDYFIKNASNYVFRHIVDELGLSDSVVEERERLESQVINNYENESLYSVQNAICDMVFHESLGIIIHKIQTLKDRAESTESFNVYYSPYAEFFDKVINFFNLKGEHSSQEIGEMIEELQGYKATFDQAGKQVFDVVEELYQKAESDFIEDLSSSVGETGRKIFNGVNPEEIVLPNGESVSYYKIQNQTKNQRNMYMLSRSTDVYPYMTEEGAKEKYQEEVSKFGYYSYSVFDEGHTTSFAGMHRIRFGFFDLPKEKTDIISCSVHDGQTNQFPIKKGKTVVPQHLMALSEFVNQTGNSYNEIVLSNPEQIIPSVVITASETPTEEEIRVAKAFNIPLIFIDQSCYEKGNQARRGFSFINYEELLKTPVGEQKNEPNLQ